ncbi:MAG: PhoX family phosphatase [Burkholderiaceae bacterium]|nr:PhoX family phosphatase [Burkholderiaceae bacterium]
MSKFFEPYAGTPNPSANPELDAIARERARRVAPQDPQRRALLAAGTAATVACVAALPACAATHAGAGPLLGFAGIAASGEDAVRVPRGYEARVLVAWGDPIGDVRGSPPFRWDASNSAAEQELQSGTHHDGMWFFPLPIGSNSSAHGLLVINHEYPDNTLLFADGVDDWTLAKVRKSQASVGCSVQEVRLVDGRWALVRPSRYARRIHANTPMRIAGPAAGHPKMRTAASPDGRAALGTFNNCANGWTPWGTYLSCEENFSFHFRMPPSASAMEERYEISPRVRFSFRWGEADARFDVAKSRNEPNHFGWVVEIDPYAPDSVPVKRTALGRFSHEGATVAECADGRVAVYSGDDRAFEYIYKFVSERAWNKADRAANRDLLDHGTLYVARFDADGSGEWIALVHGRNGLGAATGFDSQGAVARYARAAADRAGATKMDRPEWIARHPATGDLYCTLTNNTARGAKGREGATAVNPRAPNRHGHIVRWSEHEGDCAATRFRWEIFVVAGDPMHAEPQQRGNIRGDLFASPDGLMIDARGLVWVQTDVSPSVLSKGDHAIYGNNQMLAVDPATREVRRFMTGPRGCELTGACMTPDGRTMFVNVQHPGEADDGDVDPDNPRKLSNWPDFRPDGRPRSGTVAIRRNDGGVVGS